ncbi:MAG: hypothetical protein RL720_638 [Actinomycetota bacterium]
MRPSLLTEQKVSARILLLGFAWVVLYALNEWFWNALYYQWLGLNPAEGWVAASNFFVYDFIKIVLLVIGITFIVTVLQSFISVEKTQKWLSGRGEGVGHLLAASLGVITPFCSCSSVPLFIGFLRGGIPLGVTMTFLIASPLISEVAVVLLGTFFGWHVALIYVAAGFVVAIFSGWLIQRLKLERWVEPFVTKTTQITNVRGFIEVKPTLQERITEGIEESVSLVKTLLPYLAIGLAVGAVLHGWVPSEAIAAVAGKDNFLAVPLVVLIGIPLYGGAASVLPLIEVLASAGIPIGTLLALMMSVIGLSLPEMILLKKVLKPQLLLIFIGIIAVAITLIGYLFNALF